jgi:O-antigen/teichoic acid export membrane protein
MTTSSLKQAATQGAIWTILGYGSSQALRLVSNLILTRLLVPEFFGLMSLVNTINVGIALFSDYGIGQSIVNNKRGDEEAFLNTAWTLQIIRGFQIFAVSLFVTYPVAQVYHDNRLLILIPLVCSAALIDGFSSTSLHTLNRRLELRRLVVYETIMYAISLVIMGVLCWLFPTVWSLAAGVVITAIMHSIASHFLIPGYRNRIQLDKEVLQEIRNFGKWIAFASATMFVADQADRFILAKLLSFEKLGVYTIAYTLASIPRELIKQLSGRVIFPAISQQIHLRRYRLRAKIIRQRWMLLLGLGLMLALLVCSGDWIISLLYQGRNKHWEQYREATWMMPILCTGIWFSILFNTTSPALLAIGKAVYSAQSNVARFILIGAGMPLAFYRFGELGAIVVIALSDFPLYLVNLYGLKREHLSCVSQDFNCTVFFFGILGLMLTARYYLGFGLPIQQLLTIG